MSSKFKPGQQVIIIPNNRTPKELLRSIRLNRKRTITSIFYDYGCQHTLYHLGSNNQGYDFSHYGFRAEELRPFIKRKTGRPRIKRRYRRKGNDAL
jgi:hypothetical protein